MNLIRSFLAVAVLLSGPIAIAGDVPPASGVSKPTSAAPKKCEHGVKKALCTRCNPKLAPVFEKKGDWCGEHKLPESQCVKCNPELAKDGVK